MRLIDVDATDEELFYKQVGGKNSLITAETAFNMIKAQPTAYDVENIIRELMYESSRWKESGEAYDDDQEKGISIGLKKAAAIIVKAGGKNEF